jgi:hypothetical protein
MWIAIGIIVGVYFLLSAAHYSYQTLWNFTVVSPAKIHSGQTKEIETLKDKAGKSNASVVSLEEKCASAQQELENLHEKYRKLESDHLVVKAKLEEFQRVPFSFSITTGAPSHLVQHLTPPRASQPVPVHPTKIEVTIRKDVHVVVDITRVILKISATSYTREEPFPCHETVTDDVGKFEVTKQILWALEQFGELSWTTLTYGTGIEGTLSVALDYAWGSQTGRTNPQKYHVLARINGAVMEILINRVQGDEP